MNDMQTQYPFAAIVGPSPSDRALFIIMNSLQFVCVSVSLLAIRFCGVRFRRLDEYE